MSLTVLLDEQKDQYSPGHSVTGKVRYSPRSNQKAEIKVKIIGEERTHYTESATVNRTKVDRSWKNNFLETKPVLIGSGELNAGHYEYPFKLTLPRRIPSSYDGMYGYVKFFVKATVERNGRETSKSDAEIKVFSPVDLNDVADENVLSPRSSSDRLMINRWCCIPEVINMDVKLEKNAYTLGEIISVVVDLTNNSSMSVSALKTKLLMKTQVKMVTPRQEFRTIYRLLASEEFSGINSYQTKCYTSKLKIPTVTKISNFAKCKLFTQKTLLEVTAVLQTSSKPELVVETEVFLGHFPFDKTGKRHQEKMRLPSTPNATRSSPKITQSTSPKSTSIPYSPISNVTSITLPPYPTDSNPTLFPSEFSSGHTNSSNQHLQNISNVHCPFDKTLSSKGDNPPYPKSNSLSSQSYSFEKSSAPYPTGNSYPYPVEKDFPQEESKWRKPNGCPYPAEEFKSPKPSCPYPIERSGKPNPDPPYPKDDFKLSDKSSVASSSIYSSYEGRLPYPSKSEEETSLLRKMPMPVHSMQSFEREDIELSKPLLPSSSEDLNIRAYSDNLYPPPMKSKPLESPSSSIFYSAPYPPENPSVHSSIGFADITPMPMPNRSPIPCEEIGFAVPVSKPAKPIHLQIYSNPLDPQEIKTPPMAEIRELEELLLSLDEEMPSEAPPSYEEICSSQIGKKKKTRSQPVEL